MKQAVVLHKRLRPRCFPYQIGAVVRAKRAPAAALFCTKSTSSTNNGISPQNGEFIEGGDRLLKLYRDDILSVIQAAQESGEITSDDAVRLTSVTRKLIKHLYRKYESVWEAIQDMYDNSLGLDMDEYLENLANKQDEIDAMKAEIDNQKAEIDNQKAEIDNQKAEIVKKEAENLALREEIARLKAANQPTD